MRTPSLAFPAAIALVVAACGDPHDAPGGFDSSDSTDSTDSTDAPPPDSGDGMDPPDPPDAPDLPDEVVAALDLPAAPFAYDDPLPAHFAGVLGQDNTPIDNPITDDGATLGRVLFYDTALSQNGTIACASCHQQAFAFTDPARFSTGFAGGKTSRNAMSLIEARFYLPGRFFWDERADTLEEQVLMPVQNQLEMGLTLAELVANVEAQPYYAYLFTRAFGDPEVSDERIALALAQFVRATVSYRSRFDEGIAAAGDVAAPFPNYSPAEQRGKMLFLGPAGCATCHLDSGPPPPPGMPRRNQAAFLINMAVNNGLDATTDVDDVGVGGVTGRAADLGKFKSPSLRNVELTGPYMHDGRLTTLAEVVDHYADRVQPHPNLDGRLRAPGGQPRRLNLSPADRAALVAFLRTLTDDALIEDPRFADPFKAHE